MEDDRLTTIIAAIRTLKPEDFTKAGPPNMASLKALVPDVIAEERDAAWSKIQEETVPASSPEDDGPKVVTCADVVNTLRSQGHAI